MSRAYQRLAYEGIRILALAFIPTLPCGRARDFPPGKLNSEEQIEFIIDKAEKLELFPKEATREQNRRFIDVIIGTLNANYT
ncbi:MAG: hypothetical protein F6K40_01730 [Okeania sp. SIO3I5]|uniref:hypothetical protein n=1 Tax=Okeania sp. SIO3I5 TaxID=2607805 RepID=UPI0013BD2AFD|nr:hypothetical protein [Okeania sp. SIO3I5]NEQ35096.1 hypothetical protein [Okeania sp. SIO3I5]